MAARPFAEPLAALMRWNLPANRLLPKFYHGHTFDLTLSCVQQSGLVFATPEIWLSHNDRLKTSRLAKYGRLISRKAFYEGARTSIGVRSPTYRQYNRDDDVMSRWCTLGFLDSRTFGTAPLSWSLVEFIEGH